MDLRLVEYFIAVIDHGGITRAARALYIAQPSLSQAVRALERQLGVHLFDRSGGRLTLTPDGEAFEGPARKILADAELARSRVQSVRDLHAGRLEISALSTLSMDPLPDLTSRLRQQHPTIMLNVLDPGSAAGVLEHVRRGEAELGLTALPVRSDTLLTREVGEQEIVLALPHDLAADLPDPVPLEQVATVPLVVEFSDAGGRVPVDEALRGVVERVAVECAHRQAVWDLVMHGAGATFLPRGVAENALRGVLVRSMEPPVRRTIGFAHRAGPLSPAATALLDVAAATRAQRRH